MSVQKGVALFKTSYEALAGSVYLVADEAGVVPVIADILDQIDRLSCVALVSATLQPALQALCQARHVKLLCAPFPQETLPQLIDTAQVGITHAACAVAEAGAVVEVTTNDEVRLVSTLPAAHICVLRAADIVMTLEEAAPQLEQIFASHPAGCAITFISGPSRTADIEMKLILGVHGPKASHVIVVDAR